MTLLEESLLEGTGDGGLSGGGETGEPDGESLLSHKPRPLLRTHVTLVKRDVR